MALEKIVEFFSDKEERPNRFTLFMGNAIRTAREEMGIRQKDLSKKIYKRQATLSDIENGKVEVDASTLSLLSYYLRKPIAYFYPKPLYEELVQGDMTPLSLEMQMQFEQIYGDDLQKLAIAIIRVLAKFDPKGLVVNLAGDIKLRLDHEKEISKKRQKRTKQKK